MQPPYIKMLSDEYGAESLIQSLLSPYEVKGVRRVRQVERLLFESASPPLILRASGCKLGSSRNSRR